MSLVRFAAMMPAILAAAMTSPFGISLLEIAAAVSGFIVTVQRATARRAVAFFAVTSTMCALPDSSRCVNSGVSPTVIRQSDSWNDAGART